MIATKIVHSVDDSDDGDDNNDDINDDGDINEATYEQNRDKNIRASSSSVHS